MKRNQIKAIFAFIKHESCDGGLQSSFSFSARSKQKIYLYTST